MDRALSYLRSYWPLFQREAKSSSSTLTISPSTSTGSTSSDESSLSSGLAQSRRSGESERIDFYKSNLIVPHSNEEEIFDSILERALEPQRAPLPTGWSNYWSRWEYNDELTGPFERSNLEIYLVHKYHLSFDAVQLLMYEMDTEQMVFQYQGRYYRYEMQNALLFLYPNSSESVGLFLNEWESIQRKAETVHAKGTDEKCLDIMSAEHRAAVEIAYKTMDPNIVKSALSKN
ncbi:hypothetical protein C8J56DRAFT_941966 [Mycena floridula]|nr:hypothetical protein C8J56DRAFT_941966 [Mycena floridula]